MSITSAISAGYQSLMSASDRLNADKLANRLVEPGDALSGALELAQRIASFPQLCMRSDRRSAYEQWSMTLPDALLHETKLGLEVIRSGETLEGATRFASGAGRHGKFE